MADSTKYYGLTKPDGSDLVDIDDLNGNFDIIDEAMKANADTAGRLDAVQETDVILTTDYIYLERDGTIYKLPAEKMISNAVMDDLVYTESGEALTTEEGEYLLLDTVN